MTVYSFGKINSEKELSFEEKKYQKVAARWTIPVLLIPLVFGIWNVFLGYESIYLILMTSFFTGILIWTGFILRYAQENKIRL